MSGAWPQIVTVSGVMPRVLAAPVYRATSWMSSPVGAPSETPGETTPAAVLGAAFAGVPGVLAPVAPAAVAAGELSVLPAGAGASPPEDLPFCEPDRVLDPAATRLLVVPTGATATE